MTGQIKIEDGRINKIAANEGFLSTINPNTFSSVYEGTIQTGRQIQNLGYRLSNFQQQQKRLADSLALDDLLNNFEEDQLNNEIKINSMTNEDPTQLIDKVSGKSLLANKAYGLGVDSQTKITSSDKFNNLGSAYQDRFKSVTQHKINMREIKAKLDTTKLLHGLQLRKDDNNLNKLLADGNNPTISDEAWSEKLAIFKAQIINDAESMGIRDPKELEDYLKDVDKKVFKQKYGKAMLGATMKGTPEAVSEVDQNLRNGVYGSVSPEDLPAKRLALYKAFSTSLTAQDAKKNKVQEEKENKASVDFLQKLKSGDFTEDEMSETLTKLGDGLLKGNFSGYSQLQTDVDQHFRPEKESQNSPNQKMNLKIASVDINNPGALNEYLALEKELGQSNLSFGDQSKRQKQINTGKKLINDEKAKAAASHKKDMKRRIDQKLRKNKNPITSFLGGNLGTIKNVAEDTFEQLILQGDDPKVAWDKIDDILEQSLQKGFTLNVTELEEELGIDVKDINRRQALNPSQVSDEEMRGLYLYLAAKKANAASPLLGKNKPKDKK